MVGMPGTMNSYLLQNLNQILASGMGGPLAGMLGQFAQLPSWGQAKPGMWQQDKVTRFYQQTETWEIRQLYSVGI